MEDTEVMGLRKTSVVVDQGLLDAARRILGTRTVRDTIEKALLEVLRARARADEVRALASMRDLDLSDAEIMAGAWRG